MLHLTVFPLGAYVSSSRNAGWTWLNHADTLVVTYGYLIDVIVQQYHASATHEGSRASSWRHFPGKNMFFLQYIVNYLVRDVKSAVIMPNGLGEKSRWVQKTGRHFFGIKSEGWCYDFNDLLRAALPQFLLAIHMENCWGMEHFAPNFMGNCSYLPRYGCSLWLCHRYLSLVESFSGFWSS